MKKASSVRIGLLVMVSVLLLSSPVLAAWGSKELDTEKIAVTLVREVERGGYKIVTTEELKGWIDQKKEMLILGALSFGRCLYLSTLISLTRSSCEPQGH